MGWIVTRQITRPLNKGGQQAFIARTGQDHLHEALLPRGLGDPVVRDDDSLSLQFYHTFSPRLVLPAQASKLRKASELVMTQSAPPSANPAVAGGLRVQFGGQAAIGGQVFDLHAVLLQSFTQEVAAAWPRTIRARRRAIVPAGGI
jgi:hypothetical protein